MASIAFFPSLYGKAVPGLCVLSLSLISVKRRISYPVMMEQIDKAPTNNPPDVSKKQSPGKRGRPQGSKNRNRRAVALSPALRFVQETITRFLQLIGEHVKVIYFVYDGAFGNNDALQMVKQTGLHLISKLQRKGPPFSDGWEQWKPNPSWRIPVLGANGAEEKPKREPYL